MTTLLPVSATYALPAPSRAIPAGDLKPVPRPVAPPGSSAIDGAAPTPLRPNCEAAPRADLIDSVARSTPGWVGEKVTVMVQSVVVSEFRVQLPGETTKSALPATAKGDVADGVSPTAK